MTIADARRLARKLALGDIATSLLYRFLSWLGLASCAFSIALLASVALLESAWRPSALAFHAVILTALGSLPAFLAYPFRRALGLEAVRRWDRQAAVETWLGYPGGPAERLLEARAFEALSIAVIAGTGRPRPGRRARALTIGAYALALAAFVAAQGLSLRSGYGLSLGYPEKRAQDVSALRPGEPEGAQSGLVVAGEDYEEQPDAPGARRYASARGGNDEGLAEPDFVAPGAPEAGDGAPTGEAGPEAARAAGKTGEAAGRTGSKGSADAAPGGGAADGGDREGRDAGAEARSPGFEGSGRALDASPLVDYRARFERQLAESLGKETVLGDEPSAETVSASIARYYASFDARVAIGSRIDPSLARTREAWRRAFGPGGSE